MRLTCFHKLIPTKFLKRPNFISYWLFGAEKNDRKLLKEILQETDEVFLSWAIDKILHWKNLTIPENVIQIHGTKDRILPIKFSQPDHKIINGGHFMTVNKYPSINQLLEKLL